MVHIMEVQTVVPNRIQVDVVEINVLDLLKKLSISFCSPDLANQTSHLYQISTDDNHQNHSIVCLKQLSVVFSITVIRSQQKNQSGCEDE